MAQALFQLRCNKCKYSIVSDCFIAEIFSITLEQKGEKRGFQYYLIQAALSLLVLNDLVSNQFCFLFSFFFLNSFREHESGNNGDILR